MGSIEIQKGKTLIIAHRGLSALETENTCAAFVAAGNRSYYGIETDIHRTADGRFITIHDGDLNRVAGANVSVEESTLSQLQSIVLIDKDGSKNRADLRIPTLEDYICICKKYNKHCVLELKSDFTEEEIKKITRVIENYDYLKQVTFISFNYENLLRLRKILPKQSAQFLFGDFNNALIEKLATDKIDIDIKFRFLTKENIKKFHELGLKVNCWTVDKKKDAERLIEWGVDFITTNILE